MNKLPENQSNAPARITWSLIGSDLLEVLNLEKGIFYTIKGLFLTPKATIDDYLYGNRSQHANPLRFLIFSTALATLLNFYFVFQPAMDNGAYLSTQNDSLFDSGEAFGESVFVAVTDKEKADKEDISTQEKAEKARLKKEKKEEVLNIAMNALFSWMDKITFAMVPIFALFSFLFFKNAGYNYTENLVINAFMISVNNVIGIVFVPITLMDSNIGSAFSTLLSSVFMVYFTFKVFASGSVGSFFRTLLSFLISYFLFFLLMVGFILVMIYTSLEGV
jgi:hypothetical protein